MTKSHDSLDNSHQVPIWASSVRTQLLKENEIWKNFFPYLSQCWAYQSTPSSRMCIPTCLYGRVRPWNGIRGTMSWVMVNLAARSLPILSKCWKAYMNLFECTERSNWSWAICEQWTKNGEYISISPWTAYTRCCICETTNGFDFRKYIWASSIKGQDSRKGPTKRVACNAELIVTIFTKFSSDRFYVGEYLL